MCGVHFGTVIVQVYMVENIIRGVLVLLDYISHDFETMDMFEVVIIMPFYLNESKILKWRFDWPTWFHLQP